VRYHTIHLAKKRRGFNLIQIFFILKISAGLAVVLRFAHDIGLISFGNSVNLRKCTSYHVFHNRGALILFQWDVGLQVI
jgi:hypothetical protein